MAIQFLAGFLVGGAAIIAAKNKDKIKNVFAESKEKIEKFAVSAKGTVCEYAEDAKGFVGNRLDEAKTFVNECIADLTISKNEADEVKITPSVPKKKYQHKPPVDLKPYVKEIRALKKEGMAPKDIAKTLSQKYSLGKIFAQDLKPYLK